MARGSQIKPDADVDQRAGLLASLAYLRDEAEKYGFIAVAQLLRRAIEVMIKGGGQGANDPT